MFLVFILSNLENHFQTSYYSPFISFFIQNVEFRFSSKEFKGSLLKKFRRKNFNRKVSLSRFSRCSNKTCFHTWKYKAFRNGKTFLSKPEIVTKYNLKTSDHFSKSFLNCFKLDIFEERLGNLNIWLNDNMTYVLSPLKKTSLILI